MLLVKNFKVNFKNTEIDRFSFLCLILFLLNIILFNLILIPGDEPDYSIRKLEYLSIFSNLLPNQIINIIHTYSFSPYCSQLSLLDEPFFYIDLESCWPVTELFFSKMWVGTFNSLPIWILSIYRKKIFSTWYDSATIKEIFFRIDAVIVALTLPSMVYHICLISPESFSLTLNAIAFIFINHFWIVLMLIAFAGYIDPGNTMIFVVFMVYWLTFSHISRMLGLKGLFIFGIFLLGLSYSFNIGLLEFISQVLPFNLEKINSIIALHQDGYYLDKYPLVYRILNTTLGFILFTPAANKVYLSYGLFFIIFIFYIFNKTLNKNRSFNELDISIIAILLFIICLNLVIPAYSNAKYLVFVLVIIVRNVIYMTSKYNFLKYSIFFSSLTIFNLLLNYDY